MPLFNLPKQCYNYNMFLNRKCKITFIKHGATINTEENRFFDDEKYPAINETGRLEMEKISEWIADTGLKTDKIYTSPSLRCIQSTRILADILKQDFEILNNLTGRKNGIFSGLTAEEINKKYKGKFQEYYANPEKYTPDGGESLKEFNLRVNSLIDDIIQANPNKRLVIVTHGEIIRSAISNILDIPLNSQFKIYVPTASATQISYFENFASLIYSAYKLRG